MPQKFRMTNTELKLKRDRMISAFKAGKESLEELHLSYFLAYGAALGALREGQFQPHEDDILVGIYQWDLAELQRNRTEHSAAERDGRIMSVFERHGFDPVSEVQEPKKGMPGQEVSQPESINACPRTYQAETWSEEQAFPILYKFTHRESIVKFIMIVFTQQFGQLWDFADGGAETSSGWRYTPFSPQPIEFHKIMTYTMPALALEEHYGQNWHAPQDIEYVQNLSKCKNRCQVLRVYPFEMNVTPPRLPDAKPWEAFKDEVKMHRIKFAKAMVNVSHETPPKELDLFKIESKPMVLFQAAGICKAEGNELLKSNQPQKALEKYDEGRYIVDKCQDVLLNWRLIFRTLHQEKAEKDSRQRGLKVEDLTEPDLPPEFSADQREEQQYRLALLLNATQAALQMNDYETAIARASDAIDVDPKSLKAHYRRGLARAALGQKKAAKQDFLTMCKLSDFDSREALQQLMKILPKEEVEKEVRNLKNHEARQDKLGQLLTSGQQDPRIALQDERYERFKGDVRQRKADGQPEITFDQWARQYEWRYDAGERQKIRARWPQIFNHMGPAPLPVEAWEVDYLTHKEVEKIMYQRETKHLAALREQREGPRKQLIEKEEAFAVELEVDDEDQEAITDSVIKKGYNYWW
mmetsp:Transcript_10907/g.20491  ORF Transcript_10907/g.20491 Transcript_10907/m.20491 type:complete len:640 (+) Transcript_10907:124-2043(+)